MSCWEAGRRGHTQGNAACLHARIYTSSHLLEHQYHLTLLVCSIQTNRVSFFSLSLFLFLSFSGRNRTSCRLAKTHTHFSNDTHHVYVTGTT